MSKKKNKVKNKGNGFKGKKKVDEFDFEKDKLEFKPFLEGKNKSFLNKIFSSPVALAPLIVSFIEAQETSLLKNLKNHSVKEYNKIINNPEILEIVFSLHIKNINFIKDLINNSLFDINKTDLRGNTILHYAAGHELASLVSLILNQSNVQLLANNLGRTPLHTASLSNNNSTILEQLITKFDEEAINSFDKSGQNFVHYLSSRKFSCISKIVEKLFKSESIQKKVLWDSQSLTKSERDKYLKTQEWFKRLDNEYKKSLLETDVDYETPMSGNDIVNFTLNSGKYSIYNLDKDLPSIKLEYKNLTIKHFEDISMQVLREITNPKLIEKQLIKFTENLSKNILKQASRKDAYNEELNQSYLYQSITYICNLYQMLSDESLMLKFLDSIEKVTSKYCSSKGIIMIANIYNEQAVYYIDNYNLQFANLFAKKALDLVKKFDKIVDKTDTAYVNLLECIYHNIYMSNRESDPKTSIEALKKTLELNPDNAVEINYNLFEHYMTECNFVEAEKCAYVLKDLSIYKYLKLLTDYPSGKKVKFDDFGSLNEIEKETKSFSEKISKDNLLYSHILTIYRQEGKFSLEDELKEYHKQLKNLKKNFATSKKIEDHIAFGLSILVNNKLHDNAKDFIKKHEGEYKNLDKNIYWTRVKCLFLSKNQEPTEFIELINSKKDSIGENTFKLLVTNYISSSFSKGKWEACKKLYSLLSEKEMEDLPEEYKFTQESIASQKIISKVVDSKKLNIIKDDCTVEYLSFQQLHKFHTNRKKLELDKKYEFKMKYQNSWFVKKWNNDCSKKIKQLVKYDDKDVYFAKSGLYFTFDKKILNRLEKENKLDSFLQAAEKGVATSFYGQNGFKFIKANNYEFYELKTNSKTRVISNKIYENPLCNKLVILNKVVDNHDNLSKVFKKLKSSVEYVPNISSFSEEQFTDVIGDIQE